MTFLELCQRLQRETGTGGSAMTEVTGHTGALQRIVDWINSAYKDIQNKWLDWKFLWAEGTIALVNGTRDYDPPANTALLLEDTFFIGDEQLEYVPHEVYRRDRPAHDGETGTPTSFTILPNGKVRVFPTPTASGTVNLEYQKTGLAMSVKTETPVIPTAYQDVVWILGKWYWAVFEESELEIRAADILYQAALKRLEANQLPNREQGRARSVPIQVVPE